MEYYIKAIPNVIKKFPKIMFYIVGDGEDKEKLHQLAKELHVENNLTFLGFRSDVSNVIKQLDLVVLSSLWEGLPLTPIEVFSEGKSVIATDVDGTPEIVIDQYNGLLIKPKCSDDICNGIIKLINCDKERKEMEKNSYNTYLKKFSIEKFQKEYLKYCNEIINEKGGF